jgi:hypothetical protein
MDEHPLYFFKRKPLKCPSCGAKKVASIFYGMPSFEARAAVEAGKIVLGGCEISSNNPAWECTSCGTQIYPLKNE